MSRLARAVEILEAINEHFQEHDGQTVLYSDAQILDGDITIKDAIAEYLGQPDTDFTPILIVPRSKRRRINFNTHTGWSGWIGKRKVEYFINEEAARKWLNSSES